jgi:hypothetical protein
MCTKSGAGLALEAMRLVPQSVGLARLALPPTIRLFFPLAFFLVRFWAFLGKGSSKTPLKYFGKKSV